MKHLFYLIAIIFLISSCNYSEIMKNKKKGIEKVLSKNVKKGGYYLIYKYTVDNVGYSNSSGMTFSEENADIFINKYFPVVYSSKKPRTSVLLVDPDDFKRFEENFPDSLIWVEKYLYRR